MLTLGALSAILDEKQPVHVMRVGILCSDLKQPEHLSFAWAVERADNKVVLENELAARFQLATDTVKRKQSNGDGDDEKSFLLTTNPRLGSMLEMSVERVQQPRGNVKFASVRKLIRDHR